jgi:phasin family protein
MAGPPNLPVRIFLCSAQKSLDCRAATLYIALVLRRSKTRRHRGIKIIGRNAVRLRKTASDGRTERKEDMAAKITEVPLPAEEAAGKGAEATVSTLKGNVAKAAAGLEATQATVKEGMGKVMKTAEDFVTFSQGNIEAFVKAGQIWTTGLQDLSKHFVASAKESLDDSIATFKAISTAKSLKDALDLQTAYARSTLEKTMAESGKLTDASFKLTEQALAPLTARVTVAVEKFSKAA